RRVAHHGHRSAAGGGVGAGRDQHRAQPRLLRHLARAGGRRPEDRAVAPRRRDRDAQGADRGRAAERAGRAADPAQAVGRRGRARVLPAQRAPRALQQGRARAHGGEVMSVITVAVIAFVAFFIGVPILLGVLRFLGAYTVVEERRAHVYTLF